MGLNKVQSVAGNFVNCGPVHSLKQILGKYPEKKEKKKQVHRFQEELICQEKRVTYVCLNRSMK